jgi:hypothetical protein
MNDHPSLGAALQQALAHHQAGRNEQAIRLYRDILAIAPGLAEIHNNLGIALAALGRFDEAAASCRHALDAAPGQAEAHINLGNILHAQGRAGEAAAAYRRALKIAPNDAGTLYNFGNLLIRETALPGSAQFHGDRIEECFACLERYARLAFGGGGTAGDSPPHKLRHDEEQRQYLGGVGGFRLAEAGRIPTPAVNPGDAAAISDRWRGARPQIVVIDNLLSEEALDKLRRFCWGSTIWRQPHPDGYLTALPEFGLACPLLAQIAEELAVAYPAVFQNHGLRYLWAFKYDSRRSGVAVHADQAAVNVNFWITPDEANRDPESGGLVIWDAAAPPDWNFSRYNGDTAAAREFLRRAGAKPAKVPYRANRAVIFDSDLFHETDRIAFRDGYLNRRINITLLYGTRSGK